MECWKLEHSVLIPTEYRFNCVSCPLLHQQGHIDGWQVISFFSVDVCISESYLDCHSHFVSVLPRHHVHYLNVVPVKCVTIPRLCVLLADFLLPYAIEVLCSFILMLSFLSVSPTYSLSLPSHLTK